MIDKGAGKGALVLSERKVTDKATGEPVATVTQTMFCRADGGFGGPPRDGAGAASDPGARARRRLRSRHAAGNGADLSAERRSQSAACRARGGASRPAIRGRSCTGSATSALPACGAENHVRLRPEKLVAFACRFSAPVFPGETLRTEMWRDGDVVSFRSRVVERDVIAVNNGRAEVRP